MRHLRAGRLIELESGLWAVDVAQPVAAVLDPLTGAVRGTVSWSELPPGPPGEVWPPARVLGDGSSLWAQQEECGPLVRVGLHGMAAAAWTNGLHLAACGPGVAWCAPRRPDQDLVHGAGAHPVRGLHPDRLLRVADDGRCVTVRVESRVRRVQAEPDALLVEVDVEPWHVHHLGTEIYEVVWSTRWLRLPWQADVPATLSVHSHGLPAGAGPTRRYDDGGRLHGPWHEPDAGPPVQAGGRQWHVGWSADAASVRGRQWRPVVASAHDGRGVLVGRWQLGDGTVLAAAPVGDRLAVAVAREPWTLYHEPMPVDVVALDPTTDDVHVLLAGDSVEITGQCWPLVPRPLDADSYTQQILAANSSINDYWHSDEGARSPLARGLSQARTSLTGDWPDTHLEWTFTFDRYPDLRLRRRVPLFDELGRAVEPEYADIHLMEDLDTTALPPASAAHDGVLDI